MVNGPLMPQVFFVGKVGVDQLRAQGFWAGGDEDEFFLFEPGFVGGEGVGIDVARGVFQRGVAVFSVVVFFQPRRADVDQHDVVAFL